MDGSTVRCWGAPHGAETIARALENSCNPVFTQLALRLGSERFYQYLHAFGLGRRTGIDLYGEAGGILIGQSRVKQRRSGAHRLLGRASRSRPFR